MKVKVSELCQVTNALLSHLEETGYDEIKVAPDFYWNTSQAEMYDSYAKPVALDLGQDVLHALRQCAKPKGVRWP
jgi:hypothetical protein